MLRRLAAPTLGSLLGACVAPTPPPVVEGEGGRWEQLPELAGGARQESCVVALRGEVVVVGGINALGATLSSVEAYEPVAARWRRLADLPLPLHHANCAVVDGRLVVGGFLLGVDFTPDARTFVFDVDGDTWADATPMPDGTQRGAAGAVAHQGWLYVVGGIQVASQTAVSRYSPAEDRWEELSPLPVALDHLSAHDVEGRLLVIGGRTNGIGRHTATVLELDDASGEFLEKGAMPTSRAGFAAAVLGDEIIVVGGEGNGAEASGVFDQVEAYAPSTDQWRALLPMRTPRHGMGAAVVDGALYVPGGADRQGFAAVATHERFVPVAAPP